MARPKKQTVDYFPHYVTSGKTMYILENSFGNDGYAFWFKLLELLGSTDGHCFRAENATDWMFLLAKTRVTEEKATEILNTLAKLNAIDSELWDKKIIWVQNFVDNLSEVYRKRRTNPPKKPNSEGFCRENPISELVNTDINPQSKVKESKVKKSKVEESSNSHSDEAIEICKYYSTLLPGQDISAHLATFKILIEQYGYEWTKEALQKTVSSKGKFIKAYMERILQNWQAEGKEEIKSGGTRQDNRQNKAKGEGELLAARAIEKYGDELGDFECDF
ncbi:DUF4373 domain-containing protein [Clostridium sp. MB40-C1]|uniref:Lin1244/Lin1753 domain-containing protein n=1 Tax=Clostridium sp. MB40-C1 TaxID=3070996 RepID=UPI0027E060D9|nr:Lin1244/Lin1753 domain-containing protein [Clostridium sp. MB40-C1]WMJ81944.1 DUF4373 domain-containing protein [Clostridium sp. MB40-C1]